jgi:hypothetical protein
MLSLLLPYSRKRKVTDKMFVVVSEEWKANLIHCLFMYNDNQRGYHLAKEYYKLLKNLKPNTDRTIEYVDFSNGMERKLNYCPLY